MLIELAVGYHMKIELIGLVSLVHMKIVLIEQLVDYFHMMIVVVFGQLVVQLLFDYHMIAVVVEMWTELAVEFHTK
jgi:hypothetical protein